MEQYAPDLQLLPMLPLRGLVVLPKTLIHFDVARKKSVAALESALKGDQRIFLVTQRDPRENDPIREKMIRRWQIFIQLGQLPRSSRY